MLNDMSKIQKYVMEKGTESRFSDIWSKALLERK